MSTKVYCHFCGRDFEGNEGQQVCPHISIGGSEAIHSAEEQQRKAYNDEIAKRKVKAAPTVTPEKEIKSKSEGVNPS